MILYEEVYGGGVQCADCYYRSEDKQSWECPHCGCDVKDIDPNE